MQLEFCANTEKVKSFNDATQTDKAPALSARGGSLARWSGVNLSASTLIYSFSLYGNCDVQSGEGSSCEQQLNNSGSSLCLSELRKLECFKHALVVGDVTPSVAHLRIRASAPSSLCQFPVL